MTKKLAIIALAAIMTLGVFGLTACDNVSLADYKATAKAEIENYAQETDYCTEGWTAVCSLVTAGKTAIDEAENKPAVDTAVKDTKEEINAVKKNNAFPSALDEFNLQEFTNEFFENYTLILVPFEWPHLLYEHLDFYTAFAENGKLNFLIEITDPYGLGDTAIDMRVFAVIVLNTIFNSLDIGEVRVFETYDFSATCPAENNRDWLKDIERKSVEHRVSYVCYNYSSTNFPALNNPAQFKREVGGITTIASAENLREYFII